MANDAIDKRNYLTDEQLKGNADIYKAYLRQTKREGVEGLIAWLETTDFFEAPASNNYHSNFKGGLVYHTLSDLETFNQLRETFKVNISQESMILGVLLHDLCKANFYKETRRNVKKDYPNGTFKWFSVASYDAGNEDDNICLGHGESSAILALKHIHLTDEEIAMIRWHMGGYEEMGFGSKKQMSACMSRYPGVVLMQLADMASSYLKEIKIDLQDI